MEVSKGFLILWMATWFVYILQSEKTGRFYKGITQNLNERFQYHNSGFVASTKPEVPWKLVWFCVKHNKSEAVILERKLKNLSQVRLIEFMRK